MNADNLRILQKILEDRNKDVVDSWLGQYESRLDQLSGKFTALHGNCGQPSVGGGLYNVNSTNYRHALSTPTSVSSTVYKFQRNCKYDKNNDDDNNNNNNNNNNL